MLHFTHQFKLKINETMKINKGKRLERNGSISETQNIRCNENIMGKYSCPNILDVSLGSLENFALL